MNIKERNVIYLELNADNIRQHIAEANLSNEYHLKLAAIAAKKAQHYATMLEINTQTLEHVKTLQPKTSDGSLQSKLLGLNH